MMHTHAALLLLSLLIATPCLASKIDVHVHAETLPTTGDPQGDLTSMMAAKDIDKMIMMPVPVSLSNEATSGSGLPAFFYDYRDQIKLLCGGDTINYLLHGAGRGEVITSGDRWTMDDNEYSLFPEGCDGTCPDLSSFITIAQAIESGGYTSTSAYYDDFTTAVADCAALHEDESPVYIGYGEIGSYHVARRPGHPYIRFKADSTWMRYLSDAANSYGKPVSLHMELDSTSIAELEALLDYNTSTKIVLEHVGWANIGGVSASDLSTLMYDHANLYLALKKCENDHLDDCYWDYEDTTWSANGTLRSDWKTLIDTYSSRIMIGTDAKFWPTSTESPPTTYHSYTRDQFASDDQKGSLKLLVAYLIANSSSTVVTNVSHDAAANVYGL